MNIGKAGYVVPATITSPFQVNKDIGVQFAQTADVSGIGTLMGITSSSAKALGRCLEWKSPQVSCGLRWRKVSFDIYWFFLPLSPSSSSFLSQLYILFFFNFDINFYLWLNSNLNIKLGWPTKEGKNYLNLNQKFLQKWDFYCPFGCEWSLVLSIISRCLLYSRSLCKFRFVWTWIILWSLTVDFSFSFGARDCFTIGFRTPTSVEVLVTLHLTISSVGFTSWLKNFRYWKDLVNTP